MLEEANVPEVLIVQTNNILHQKIKSELAQTSLRVDRDYKLFRNPSDVQDFLHVGHDQVVVTGLLSDDLQTTGVFIRRWQAVPEVSIWWFSRTPPPRGSCNLAIPLGNDGDNICENLLQRIFRRV